MQVLKFYPSSNPDSKRIYLFFHEVACCEWEEEYCPHTTEEKSTKYISRIVYSSDNTSACCDDSDKCERDEEPVFSIKIPETYEQSR